MPGEWCGSKVRASMANNPSLDDDAALGRRTAHGQCGTTSAARSASSAAGAPTKRTIARTLRNLQHPPGQRLGPLPGGPTSITHATRLDFKIVIAHRDMVQIKRDGSRFGRIARPFRFSASRPKMRMALESEDFCTSQPPQPAALLSRHLPEPAPSPAALPHFPTPIDPMTRFGIERAITADGSPRRARRGRSGEWSKREWRSAARRLRSCRMCLPLHLRARQTADPVSI